MWKDHPTTPQLKQFFERRQKLKGAVASGELERSTMLCSWVNQLFRLGHCQKPTVSLPEDMSTTKIHMWTTTGVWEHGVFAAENIRLKLMSHI